MGKKSINLLSYLYICGMLLVVIGCFLPLSTVFGGHANGKSAFDYIGSDGKGVMKIGAILAFAGAVVGFCLSFLKELSILKIKQIGLIKLISLILSIAGGVYVFFNTSDAAKSLAKGIGKITKQAPGIGLILILAGWVIALVGWILKRD
ncbi:MAG: hypothetical protein K5786_03150 [Treponema sp.]|nr:hypothetical protein [Treponema sp.]